MDHQLKLLQSLYSTTSGKYLKFKVRFDKAIHSGRFYKLSKRKQSSLISRLKRLFERLKSLQTQLRLAGAGAALAMTLAISSPVKAQSTLGPFERNNVLNPFPPPVATDHPRPAIVDIDNDGDLDVFVGLVNGEIKFFRNDSPSGSVTRFTEVTGSANPLNGVIKGPHTAPAFADVDGDGDFDMLLGNYYGDTFYFRNIGSKTSPNFEEQTGANNPFDGITGTTGKYGTSQSIPVFVNLDGDADVDLFIGSSYRSDISGPHSAVQYFENDGSGNFSPLANLLASELAYFSQASIAFADMDNDGDLDAFVGSSNNTIQCFRQDTELTFTQVYGVANPFNGIYFSNFTAPTVGDLDKDGDLDFLIGNGNGNPYFGPDKSAIRYFENGGSFLLQDRTDLNISPFGGVDVGWEAAPVFTDLDGDGDLDAVIGSKYAYPDDLFVYINNNGEFIADPDHPIVTEVAALNTFKEDVIPVFIDIDSDQDQDLFVCLGQKIEFFRKSGDNLIHEPTLFPTLDGSNTQELSLAFIDVDNDGDFDALIGNDRYSADKILYFQNTGTASNPIFTAETPPTPFNDQSLLEQNANVTAVDLDNDGDTDLVISETYYFQSGYNGNRTRVRFFGNQSNGTFEENANPLIEYGSPALGFTSFADIDGDGDLDAFMGNGYTTENGMVTYFENTNPSPTTQFPTTVLPVDGGAATLIFPTLILTDTDNDKITEAIVSITNFRVGDEILTFTPQSGITGSFNTSTGVLTFTGLASIASYQAVLKSITYQFIGTPPTTSGRQYAGRTKVVTLNRSIIIGVLDQDLTGIIQNTLAVQVSFPDPNLPPVITPPTAIVAIGNTIDLDFSTLISDPNNNLDPASFKVIQDPISGATYTLTGLVVKLDYAGRSFTGQDQFTVEICDLVGACSTSIVTVDVVGDIVVYNGFSPNGDASNPYFEIGNITLLEPQNKVSIFNRWGDRVFEIENYDNNTNRFEGKNNNGNELPSGVYFYRIEFSSGREELSGYLTIKK